MRYTFEHSPVNELVLGVQYEGPAFTINDEINIYSDLKNAYPVISEVPPLPAVVENTDAPQTQKILNNWVSRKHFISPDKDRLIQIQPDRILFNWRKENQTDQYPRFETVYTVFREILSGAEKHKEPNRQRNQYEMTYVDHVSLKSFTLDNYDVSSIFNIVRGGRAYKNLLLNYSYPDSSVGGAVTASLKSGMRRDSKERIIVIEATCRGFLADIKVDDWFLRAHDALLDHFSDIITDKAKSVWGFREE